MTNPGSNNNELLFGSNNAAIDPAVVAYHEAGHVVGCIRARLPISKVTIVPQTNGWTGVTTAPLPTEGRLEALPGIICMLMAGPIAERLYCGLEGIESAEWPGGNIDLRKAERITQDFFSTEEEARAWLEGFPLPVECFVMREWRHIRRVATALVEQQTLSGEAISALCRL